MIKWMMSNQNVANLMGGALEHGASRNMGVDQFAIGQWEVRAYGGRMSGGFNVGGGLLWLGWRRCTVLKRDKG